MQTFASAVNAPDLEAPTPSLPLRTYGTLTQAGSWREIWEASTYYARISRLLETAERHAILVGWQVDSRLPFEGPHGRETLKQKVLRLCNAKPDLQIYFLMWDHAYFYCLERETLQGRVWDDVHPQVHFQFDNRHPWGASHHEKIALIDGRHAFCGGIDLCDERWDTAEHRYVDRGRSRDGMREHHGPYHDLAVEVSGAACRPIHEHVARRWRLLSTLPFPEAPPAVAVGPRLTEAHSRVYISQTLAEVDAGESGPALVREVEFLFHELIARAQERIIMEGQYYWSESLNDRLIAKLHEMRGRPFELTLVLADLSRLKSLTRQMSMHELRLLTQLTEAARICGTRLRLGFPQVLGTPSDPDAAPPARPVYVHSKLMLVDNRYLSIGSANFADRALRVDTEMQVTLEATTPEESAHIDEVAGTIARHWNLEGDPDREIQLRPFNAREESARLERAGIHLLNLRWSWFFDPPRPWLHGLKRVYRRLERRHPALWTGLCAAACSAGAIVATLASPDLGSSIYTSVLAATWFLPIPFVPVCIAFAAHLGGEAAARGAVWAIWIAALTVYVLCRMFPTPAGRYFQKRGASRLPARIGFRSFPYLIAVLADPRVSLHSKLAYQGLYCVPAPWFGLATLLVMPGAAWVFARLVGASWTTIPGVWVAVAAIFVYRGLRAFRSSEHTGAGDQEPRQSADREARNQCNRN